MLKGVYIPVSGPFCSINAVNKPGSNIDIKTNQVANGVSPASHIYL
jgi:hypothetical protein